MRSTRPTTRSLAALLTAGVLALAVAGTAAAAVIYVYSNGFSSKESVRELDRLHGGKQCDKRFRKGAKDMSVAFKGKRFCEYSPPVFGDAPRPDHAILAKGKILTNKTPKRLRRAAYLAVRVRVGGGDSYELQVRPKGRRFKLLRNPSSAAVSERGRSNAIKPPGKLNTLRLAADGSTVRAFVNGKFVASADDPNPDQIGGRRVGFGLGSRKASSGTTAGVFKRVRVGLVR